MEVVDPITSWIMPMGYKVEEDILIVYVDHLLSKLVDPSVSRFGTFKEKSLKVHAELAKPVISKKIRKELEELFFAQGFTKEIIDEARTRFEASKAGFSSVSTDRQTRSVDVKKENPPPPPQIQIRRK